MLRIISGLIAVVLGISNLLPLKNSAPEFGVVALIVGIGLIVWSIADNKSEYDSEVATVRESLKSVIQDPISSSPELRSENSPPAEPVMIDEETKLELLQNERDALHSEAENRLLLSHAAISQTNTLSESAKVEMHTHIDEAHTAVLEAADETHFPELSNSGPNAYIPDRHDVVDEQFSLDELELIDKITEEYRACLAGIEQLKHELIPSTNPNYWSESHDFSVASALSDFHERPAKQASYENLKSSALEMRSKLHELVGNASAWTDRNKSEFVLLIDDFYERAIEGDSGLSKLGS